MLPKMERNQGDDDVSSAVFDRISFLAKQLPLLNQATNDDASPTPGYMYKEICNMTFQSGSHCQAVLEFLVNRLDTSSCHVKYKALKIMKHVVEHGHPGFYQTLRKNARGIQQATGFSGPPDPLHGNAPYVSVRNMAKELSQQLFEVDHDEFSDRRQPVTTQSGGIGSASVQGKLEGFGNVTASSQQESLGDSIVRGIKDLAMKVSDGGQDKDKIFSTNYYEKFGGYQPAAMEGVVPVPQYTMSRSSVPARPTANRSQPVKIHTPGVAGGGWEDSDEEEHPQQQQPESLEDTQYQEQEEAPDTRDVQEEPNLNEGFMSMLTTLESQPLNREYVTNIIQRCQEVDSVTVSECLCKKLQDTGPGIIRYLLILEGLLRTDTVPVEQLTTTCQGALLAALTSKSSTVYWKARKVINIMKKLVRQQGLFPEVLPEYTGETEEDLLGIGTQTPGSHDKSTDSLPLLSMLMSGETAAATVNET